jgi:hypothetical protein
MTFARLLPPLPANEGGERRSQKEDSEMHCDFDRGWLARERIVELPLVSRLLICKTFPAIPVIPDTISRRIN